MSKTISANLKAEIESGVPFIATCWKIIRVDGTIFGFTDWPVGFDYSGTTYKAAGGYERTAIDQKEGLAVDNMDIIGIMEDSSITEDDLLSDKFRNAKVWIFLVSPPNLAWGDMKLDYGTIGEITVLEATFVAEFRSLTVKLSQKYGSKHSRYCRYILGDENCGVILEPDVWLASTVYAEGDIVSPTTADDNRYICTTAGTSNDTEGEPTWNTTPGGTTTETDGVAWKTYAAYTKYGDVTSITSSYIFTDTTFTEANSWYKFGVLEWLTGPNIGQKLDIKDSTNAGVFTTKQQSIKTIEVGNTFKVSLGCNHILKMPSDTKGSAYTGDCRAKISPETNGNAKNYGGEPELPNLDRIAAPASTVK